MSVLLKKPEFSGFTQKELVEQLEAKKKCQHKLPTWFNTLMIYYPNKLHIEQTSSEKTALYKSQLVSGKTLLDATGGLGVDSYYFSQQVEQVVHCEWNAELSKIASHNFNILGVKNVHCLAEDGLVFLEQSKQRFDWVYLDPSRRDDAKGKVFRLVDCHPDVPEHLDLLFEKTDRVLLKTSPLLDITQGISELQFVKEIHVVAVQNEVKELLWVLERGFDSEIWIKTINLKEPKNQVFDYRLEEEKTCISNLGAPEGYLYEPNAAILKAGAFKAIGQRYGLKKLHPHSHLYTSDKLVDFPGRQFQIEAMAPYSKKVLQQWGIQKANSTTRNFPESVAQIKKKLGIKDGGDTYLFFTTIPDDQKMVLRCKKV